MVLLVGDHSRQELVEHVPVVDQDGLKHFLRLFGLIEQNRLEEDCTILLSHTTRAATPPADREREQDPHISFRLSSTLGMV